MLPAEEKKYIEYRKSKQGQDKNRKNYNNADISRTVGHSKPEAMKMKFVKNLDVRINRQHEKIEFFLTHTDSYNVGRVVHQMVYTVDVRKKTHTMDFVCKKWTDVRHHL